MFTDKDMVQLKLYTEEYKQSIFSYNLSPQQSVYTSTPVEAVKACEEDETKIPIVILYREELAGFFILQCGEGVKGFSENEEAILLRAYSVDTNYQGKGIAQSSLNQLSAFVKKHYSDKKEIVLAVNHKNTIAQHVYKKCGFVDKGIRIMGKKGEQFVYHKDINEVIV